MDSFLLELKLDRGNLRPSIALSLRVRKTPVPKVIKAWMSFDHASRPSGSHFFDKRHSLLHTLSYGEMPLTLVLAML